MKLLLDTHAFIWMNAAPEKLSPRVRALCERGADAFFLSLVSAWEMQIKQQLGKLQPSLTASRMIETNISANNIALLPITLAHVRQLDSLPLHHRDPFDRMLIAQAQLEDMALVSADGKFADYPLDVIWQLRHQVATASPRRFLVPDEVGLGKTIETALILRELASRGELDRELMVVPAGSGE